MTTKFNHINCPICDSIIIDAAPHVYEDIYPRVENIQPLPQTYSDGIFLNRVLYTCTFCDFSFSTPFLADKVLSDFYSTDWFKSRITNMDRSASKTFVCNPYSLQRLLNFISFVDASRSMTFVDFGGSDGIMVQHVQALFPSIVPYVCDSNKYRHCWERRGIKFKDFSDFSDGSIDLFYTAHSIEHFPADQLNKLFLSIWSKCRKGAVLYFEVPNENFSYFNSQSIPVKYNGGPHLSHFSLKSLKTLVSKYFTVLSTDVRGHENRYGLTQINYPPTLKKNSRYLNAKQVMKSALARLGLLKTASIYLELLRSRLHQDHFVEELRDYGYFNKRGDGDLLVIVAIKD
jgi:hypothetical protein